MKERDPKKAGGKIIFIESRDVSPFYLQAQEKEKKRVTEGKSMTEIKQHLAEQGDSLLHLCHNPAQKLFLAFLLRSVKFLVKKAPVVDLNNSILPTVSAPRMMVQR